MGRGRGKGKRLTVTSHEDPGSGGEEPLPPYRRRGRPQKPLKDNIDEEETEKLEEEEGEDVKQTAPSKETKGSLLLENGRKRKRNQQLKGNSDSALEENGSGIKSNTEESMTSNGFRKNGRRRKSKPHRAAEVGVDCE